MNGQGLRTVRLIAGAGLVVLLGQAIPAFFADRMPQASGEDVLALILGDARLEFSRSLEDKAEEYFHGGLRHLDCTMQSDAAEHVHGEHEDADHDHDGAHAAEAKGMGDPWRWIDGHVHEQAHRHLKGDQTVEVLPWLWAATRMSPKNIQAYQSSAYVLSYVLDKPEDGVRLLEEGVRNNPATPELDFSIGEVLFNRLHNAARAEPWFVSTREKCLAAQNDEKHAEELALLRLRAVFYIGYLAKQRGDLDRVRACLQEAESLNPQNEIVRNLREMLNASETKR